MLCSLLSMILWTTTQANADGFKPKWVEIKGLDWCQEPNGNDLSTLPFFPGILPYFNILSHYKSFKYFPVFLIFLMKDCSNSYTEPILPICTVPPNHRGPLAFKFDITTRADQEKKALYWFENTLNWLWKISFHYRRMPSYATSESVYSCNDSWLSDVLRNNKETLFPDWLLCT